MARRRALVTQHLENVSREALERYQDIVRAYIWSRQFAKSESLRPKIRRDFRRLKREEEERVWGGRPGAIGAAKPMREPSPRNAARRGRRPVLAPLVSRSFRLVARYRGKTYRARVRKDGSISFRGRVHNSPSRAGSVVVRRSCNGWTFWT